MGDPADDVRGRQLVRRAGEGRVSVACDAIPPLRRPLCPRRPVSCPHSVWNCRSIVFDSDEENKLIYTELHKAGCGRGGRF